VCAVVIGLIRNKNVFSLDLNTDSGLLPMTDTGSEFQTDGAAHRKELLWTLA